MAEANTISSQMKAVVVKQFGDPSEVLSIENHWSTPKILPIESAKILVKLSASALNPVDYKLVLGNLSSFVNKLPYIPGLDASGTVVKVGSYCQRIKVGDEVWFKVDPMNEGSLAEYVVVPESIVGLKPKNITFEEAASIPLVGLTSWQGLEAGRLKQGQKILILGGSSGTGSIAIQIAKSIGAHITTTCSARNEEFVKQLGADEVIDYTKEKWEEVLKGKNLDLVYDCIGESGSWIKSQRVLKSSGYFVTIAESGNQKITLGVALDFMSRIMYRKIMNLLSGPYYSFVLTQNNREHLQKLKEMVESGAIKPTVEKVYPLAETKEAFKHIMSGRTRGKIVVSIP